jgi:hypothetical protein
MNQHVKQREQEDLFIVRGAMFQSDRLLLSLDQYGTALGRMWCVFEIWTAAQVRASRRHWRSPSNLAESPSHLHAGSRSRTPAAQL